jgi:hypothetical protein
MKRTISLILALFLLAAFLPAAVAVDTGYTDVPAGHWAYEVITRWGGEDYAVIDGDGSGNFFPARSLSLGELMAILSKTFGYTEREEADTSPAWSKEYVEKAIAAGILPKTGEPIDASVAVTREQAIKYIAIAYNVAPEPGETTFADNGQIGGEFKPYIRAFQTLGYIGGNSSDPALSKFNPQGDYTRAGAMQLLDNTTAEILNRSDSGKTYGKNLIIRADSVTLKNATVRENLIIGQGVGDGEVTLDNVTVEGKLIVNGGGSHSIVISGGSQIRYTVVNKQGGEPANIRVESGSSVTAVEIFSGSQAMITGNVAEVAVASNAALEIGENSVIERIEIDGDKVVVVVTNGVAVEIITINGDSVSVSGNGRVENAIVEAGAGVSVTTTGTTIVNNGSDPVDTDNGTVEPGETSTNEPEEPTPSPYYPPYEPPAPTPTPTPTPTPNPAEEEVSVETIQALRDALNNPAVSTIHIPISLENINADILIPEGKTVVLAEGTRLRLFNLTVNGTLIAEATAWLTVSGELTGMGLSPNTENGFFGTTSGYRVNIWNWYESGELVDTTGWWPLGITVTDQASLAEALELEGIVADLHLPKDFVISEGFSTAAWLYFDGISSIAADVIVTAKGFSLFDRGALTVNGEIKGLYEGSSIYLWGDSELVMNGETYAGPDGMFFDRDVVRGLVWDSTGEEWSGLFLRSLNESTGIVQATVKSVADLGVLAATYPELELVRFYGNDFAFTESVNLDGRFAYLAYGNIEVLAPNSSTLIPVDPIIVGAGVTLTIGSDAIILVQSNDDTALAIEGTDETSLIVVEDGGIVAVNDAAPGDEWAAGTYAWIDGAWVLQP